MPWNESSVMEERLRFVARLLEGERMSDVCREFGISRKTGYKIRNRYREHGVEALSDRSRRPVRYANQLPKQIERLIIDYKRERPHWGARKIRELLIRKLAGDVRIPAKSTVHAVLDRHGLVKRATAAATPKGTGNGSFPSPCTQRIVVHRLQGRIQAGKRPILLPAHRDRPDLALPLCCRGLRQQPTGRRHRGLRPTVQAIQPTRCNPLRQRCALCKPQWALQSLTPVRLVAAPGHRYRAHQTGSSATERPS